jgi:hypothetical protein
MSFPIGLNARNLDILLVSEDTMKTMSTPIWPTAPKPDRGHKVEILSRRYTELRSAEKRATKLEAILRTIEESDAQCECDDHSSLDCCAQVIGRDPGFFCAHCFAGAALIEQVIQ